MTELDSFKKEVANKLNGLTQKEWIAKNPGKHLWATYRGHESCAHCGNIRRADDNNKPCVGIVTVGLRH